MLLRRDAGTTPAILERFKMMHDYDFHCDYGLLRDSDHSSARCNWANPLNALTLTHTLKHHYTDTDAAALL